MNVQSHEESDEERTLKIPRVLQAYAKDIERFGFPMDSGLASVLQYSADRLRWLTQQLEGVRAALDTAGVATSPGKGIEGYTLPQRTEQLAIARDYFRKQLDELRLSKTATKS